MTELGGTSRSTRTPTTTRRPSTRLYGGQASARASGTTTRKGGSQPSMRRRCKHDDDLGGTGIRAPPRPTRRCASSRGTARRAVRRTASRSGCTQPRALSYLLTAPGAARPGARLPERRAEHRRDGRGRPLRGAQAPPEGATLSPRLPSLRASELVQMMRSAGARARPAPAEETPARCAGSPKGLRHGRRRDAEAIHHHYDVGNEFYEQCSGRR